MKYLAVIERGPVCFGAFVPDLPGCVAVGQTRREVKTLIRQAIQQHIQDLRERGEPVPKPNAAAELVELESA